MESRHQAGQLLDIRAELQRYVTEVKRFEEMLEHKEEERRQLLHQHEQLCRYQLVRIKRNLLQS